MLYHRLLALKQDAERQAANPGPPRLNPLAVDLGLATPLDVIDIPRDAGKPAASAFYQHMLELTGKLFDNEVDTIAYEESLRYMWGIKAFPMYTVDKLTMTLAKHVSSCLVSDCKPN